MPERLFDAGHPAVPDRPRHGVVTIKHERDHRFVKKPVPPGKVKPSPGCAECNGAKGAMQHVGAPQSLNALVRQANPHVHRTWKKAWSDMLLVLLEASGLPQPLAYVEAEGLVCFPDRAERDQGNFRVVLEKALGDVLVAGGWLPDDNWDYYEFGALRRTYEKGVASTELRLAYTLPHDKEEL